jgi:ABC-type lipoprotein release transport system permease subunit
VALEALGVPALEAWLLRLLLGERVEDRPDLRVVAFSLITTVTLGLVAGLYPALKVSRISPVEAIRNE